MMKRFPALLLLFLLVGCTPHSNRAFRPSGPASPKDTQMIGLYDPGSTLETETKGALRCYPLGGTQSTGILALQDAVILFTGTDDNCVILSRLEGPEAVPTATLTLSFPLSSQDPSIHPLEDGFSCFDPIQRKTLLIQSDLTIRTTIPAPRNLTGIPLLSRDGTMLYYCTASDVRVLDLQTGISRVLKQIRYPHQSVQGLVMEDSVLLCRIQDGAGQELLSLSVHTGSALETAPSVQKLKTRKDRYYALLQEDGVCFPVFGTADSQPMGLFLPSGAECCFLPQEHWAIGTQQDRTGMAKLSLYDLESGKCTATVQLHTSLFSQSFVSAGDGGIWFLGRDPGYGCNVLYRWDPAASATSGSFSCTYPYLKREDSDTTDPEHCQEYARKLSQRFGISILLQRDAIRVQPRDYRLHREYQSYILTKTLNALEDALSHYPEGFLQTLSQRFEGLTLCLVRSITGNAENGSFFCTDGLQFWSGHHAYIALTAGADIQQTVYHEFCHLIDTVVLTQSSAYDTWNQLNPSGFSYDYDYTANQDRNSTAYLLDSNRYFVDMYSMSYPKEDRARIMEYAMTPGNEALFQGDAMQRKLSTLCRGIREAFGLEDAEETFLWEQYLH